MVTINQNLPESNDLDINALCRIFENTTNSYKYIFFISLLDILTRINFDVSEPIFFTDITVEILANAWYPHNFFKLSFGPQDKIAEKLDTLNLQVNEPILKFTDTDKKCLREIISNQDLSESLNKSLMRYVPFRLIRTFFDEDLRGKEDYKINSKISYLAKQLFYSRKPLYYFDEKWKSIIFHPEWADYININYSIIRGWVSWKWLEYMQKCNPHVPAIGNKLFPPQKREPLKDQTNYWKLIINHTTIKCIYSGEILTSEQISLDHYLPWSFVGHDQLWNLIPTIPKVNSSKSNNLPSEKYFHSFINNQILGLTISRQNMNNTKWNKIIEPYLSDLKIGNQDKLLDFKILKQSYESTFQPLISLAKNQGFTPEWSYI